MSDIEPLIILGTHVFAEEVADLLGDCGEYELVAFAENWDRARCAAPLLGRPVLWVDDPTAHVSSTSTVGPGTIVSAGVVVASHTTIGRHVIVNRGCLIGHHTTIGNGVTISPGANIAGRVTIGDGTYVGLGAIVLDSLTIGCGSVIAAGSLVTRNVPDHVQVMGAPARITREGVEGR